MLHAVYMCGDAHVSSPAYCPAIGMRSIKCIHDAVIFALEKSGGDDSHSMQTPNIVMYIPIRSVIVLDHACIHEQTFRFILFKNRQFSLFRYNRQC